MSGLLVTFLPRYRNPYQAQLEEALSRLGVRVHRLGNTRLAILAGMVRAKPNVFHLHWLDQFFVASNRAWGLAKFALFMGAILALKLRGRRIVWTVHNLKAHEDRTPKLDRRCTAFVVKHADAVIVHCNAAKQALIEEFDVDQTEKVFVIPHGHFRHVYENRISRSEARKMLGIEEGRLLLLFFGMIRPYKGVLDLVDAFASLGADDVELVLAGKPLDEASSEVIRKRCARDRRIRYRPGFVEDDRIQVYMNACDAVVFPYRDVLTSGAVVLAMSFGRACIAPRLGCIAETLDDRGAFLYDPDEPEGLLRALQTAVERRADLPAMGAHNLKSTAPWGWDRIAAMTRDVYRHCFPVEDRL